MDSNVVEGKDLTWILTLLKGKFNVDPNVVEGKDLTWILTLLNGKI